MPEFMDNYINYVFGDLKNYGFVYMDLKWGWKLGRD